MRSRKDDIVRYLIFWRFGVEGGRSSSLSVSLHGLWCDMFVLGEDFVCILMLLFGCLCGLFVVLDGLAGVCFSSSRLVGQSCILELNFKHFCSQRQIDLLGCKSVSFQNNKFIQRNHLIRAVH